MHLHWGQLISRNKERQALMGLSGLSAYSTYKAWESASRVYQGEKHRVWARTEPVVHWQEHRLWNKINLGLILALTLGPVARLL